MAGAWARDTRVPRAIRSLLPVAAWCTSSKICLLTAWGLPWKVERTYNSLDNYCLNAFGCGWSSNLDTFLYINQNGEVDWRLSDGQAFIFTPSGGGAFTSEPGVRQQLKETSSGFEVWFPNQTIWKYSPLGRLDSIVERNGNQLQFTYTGELVTKALASNGVSYTFEHNQGNQLVTAIVSSSGHRLSYAYTDGRLTSATNLNGQSTRYAYATNGLLESITDPAGVKFVSYEYNTRASTFSATQMGQR